MQFIICRKGDPVPGQVFQGIETIVKPFLVDYEEEESSDLPMGIITEEDFKNAIYQDAGTVEVPFDRSMMERLMSHDGAHLIVAIDDSCHNRTMQECPAEMDINSVIGFSVFFTDEKDFPEEAQSDLLLDLLHDYRPFCWLFYIVVRQDYPYPDAMRGLMRKSMECMVREKCRYFVADYMIYPEVCGAGLRMMLMSYFQHSGKRYGLGLKTPEERGPGNRHRTDVYELMVRNLSERRIWKVHPSEKEKYSQLMELRSEYLSKSHS